MEDQEKKRHGFVTFWLWLMVIANVLTGISYMLGHFPTALVFVGGFAAFVNVYGAYNLLVWRKIGFWMFIASGLLSSVVTCVFLGRAGSMALFGAVAGPAILYLILQLKKEGLSCWSQLE